MLNFWFSAITGVGWGAGSFLNNYYYLEVSFKKCTDKKEAVIGRKIKYPGVDIQKDLKWHPCLVLITTG